MKHKIILSVLLFGLTVYTPLVMATLNFYVSNFTKDSFSLSFSSTEGCTMTYNPSSELGPALSALQANRVIVTLNCPNSSGPLTISNRNANVGGKVVLTMNEKNNPPCTQTQTLPNPPYIISLDTQPIDSIKACNIGINCVDTSLSNTSCMPSN